MTTLYNCKRELDREGLTKYRITKFDANMNVESSYLLDGQGGCECPAGVRPTCRHREMLPRFVSRGAINTMWMHDYERNGWVSTSLEVEFEQDQGPMFDEDNCPGHVASQDDPMICANCGVHIDSLRPDEPELPEGYAQEAIEAEAEFQAMAVDGRLHSTMQVEGAVTGRFPRKIERRGF